MGEKMKKLIAQIKRHEGLRLKPYKCPADKLTIGYGRNIEDNGISEFEAEYLLNNDIRQTLEQIKAEFEFFDSLNEARQAVIVNMVFNLGLPRFKKFKKAIAAIEQQNFLAASKEMLDSRWARQVSKRADELAEQMKQGQWV